MEIRFWEFSLKVGETRKLFDRNQTACRILHMHWSDLRKDKETTNDTQVQNYGKNPYHWQLLWFWSHLLFWEFPIRDQKQSFMRKWFLWEVFQGRNCFWQLQICHCQLLWDYPVWVRRLHNRQRKMCILSRGSCLCVPPFWSPCRFPRGHTQTRIWGGLRPLRNRMLETLWSFQVPCVPFRRWVGNSLDSNPQNSIASSWMKGSPPW